MLWNSPCKSVVRCLAATAVFAAAACGIAGAQQTRQSVGQFPLPQIQELPPGDPKQTPRSNDQQQLPQSQLPAQQTRQTLQETAQLAANEQALSITIQMD